VQAGKGDFHPVLGISFHMMRLFGNTKAARLRLSSNVFEWEKPKALQGFQTLEGLMEYLSTRVYMISADFA